MPFFAGQNRDQMRRMYLEAWRKYSARAPLEPLEAQLAAVIAEHPEYVTWLEDGEGALGAEFTPEGGKETPPLPRALPLAIRGQVPPNRPAGIAEVHQKLSARLGAHEAEHAMLEPLAETLWEAQRQGGMPGEETH